MTCYTHTHSPSLSPESPPVWPCSCLSSDRLWSASWSAPSEWSSLRCRWTPAALRMTNYTHTLYLIHTLKPTCGTCPDWVFCVNSCFIENFFKTHLFGLPRVLVAVSTAITSKNNSICKKYIMCNDTVQQVCSVQKCVFQCFILLPAAVSISSCWVWW